MKLTHMQLGRNPSRFEHAAALAATRSFAAAPLDDPAAPVCLGAHPRGFDRTSCDEKERGKHPIGSWKRDATADPARAAALFQGDHCYNVAIACGPSGIFVIDEDSRGEFERFCRDYGVNVPITYTVDTGNGAHFYFKQPEGMVITNRNPFKALGYNIDVRGDGGYVVGEGSVHQSGLVYTARDSEALVAEAPQTLLNFLLPSADRENNRGMATPRSKQRSGLSELLREPPSRGAGQTNDWLTRVAGHLARNHREDRTTFLVECRAAIDRVDPAYEDFEKVTNSVWELERRKPEQVALDDSSLVDVTADTLRHRWCWSGAHGWREWEGKVWASRTEPALVEQVRQLFLDLFRAESVKTTDPKRAAALAVLLNGGKVRGIAGLLRGTLEVDSTGFDSHPELLNCANGVADLRTGQLRPHDPELLLTKVTSTDYVPGAEHPDWDKALMAVPEQVRAWFQVRIGQAATGHRVTDELMPILYGGGMNGKTTFLSSVQAALGTHARAISDRVLTARDSDHPTELTDLQGLRVAVIEELPESAPLSVKRLKDVVGQPTITARKIAKDTVTWETTHALLLATNHKPRVNETDHGTWRRLALVRFPYVFDGGDGVGHLPGDPNLHDRMRKGRNGRAEAVLAWIVEGARRWYNADQVFPPLPTRVVQDTEDWRGESDVVVAYLAERLRFDPQSAVGTTDLLADLNGWLESHGKAPWGDQLLTERFGTHERVTVHGVEKRKGRVASSGVRVVGRDGRPLGKQPDQARLWWGVGFLRVGTSTEEVPW